MSLDRSITVCAVRYSQRLKAGIQYSNTQNHRGSGLVSSDSELLAAPVLAARYETLMRVSRAIGAHQNAKDLFAALVDELNGVVDFDAVGVFLRCQNSDRFQNHFIDMESRSVLVAEEKVSPDETFVSLVYEGQEPWLRSVDDMEPRFERLRAALQSRGFRSICALPLTTAHRRVGVISFGSKHGDAYPPDAVKFISEVVDQIALAFDDALNFSALRRASEELRTKNERLQLLLDVTNQFVSNLELRDLLRAISQGVRRVMHSDYMGLSLPEDDEQHLRLHALDFPGGKGFLHEELVYPIDGSPSGTTFRTMKPLTARSPFAGWLHFPIVQIALREGLKSFCFLPLVSRNHAIGVLVLARLRDDAFTDEDVHFLEQIANQIALAVENALAYREIRDLKDQLSKEKLYLEDEIRSEMNFTEIIGKSPSLGRVLKLVERVAPTDSAVLIYGETGTGKELIARAIHDLSPRRAKPFVKLNCAALPTGLLESELFGHEKGAFTGAIAQRIGRFEVADSGTIFLDEIGEIPLELQTKLLRVLQEREFERLGSSKTLRTDARLIAATNRNLEALVAEQKFRSDLFFRINVFPVHVPSLRERDADIPLLVRHFTQQFSRRMNKVIDTIPSATMNALRGYQWPGNIRELQNMIERAVIISTGPVLSLDVADLKLPPASFSQQKALREKASESAAAAPTDSKTNGALRDVLHQTERQKILEALERSNWVVAGPKGAAAQLGTKRSTLQQKIRKLGLTRGNA
jgi:formate hydrogenlyase transcriptional activator